MSVWDEIGEAAAGLHRQAFVFDAHADTLTEMTDRGYDLDAGPAGSQLDLPRCAGGVLDAQVFTCFVNPKCLPQGADRVRAQLATMDRQLARLPGRVALCTRPGDLGRARQAGRLGAVLAIEGGHAIENDLGILSEFVRRGVRTMTLTWNNSNEWADGCGDAGRHGGLSARGREVVAAMEAHGMVLDVSHVAESTFEGVLEVARTPLLASHSCARALREHPRNLHDDQLRAIAASGGVACVNFYPTFLVAEGQATLDHLLDHFDRFLAVAGEDHVGLGSDFDGIPITPRGVEDVAALPRVTAGLLARGHSPEAVTKVLGSNLLRLFDAAPVERSLPAQGRPGGRADVTNAHARRPREGSPA